MNLAESYKYILRMIIYKFSKRERLFVNYGLLAVQLPLNFQLIYQHARYQIKRTVQKSTLRPTFVSKAFKRRESHVRNQIQYRGKRKHNPCTHEEMRFEQFSSSLFCNSWFCLREIIVPVIQKIVMEMPHSRRIYICVKH